GAASEQAQAEEQEQQQLGGSVEIPASRSSISDATGLMHNLSLNPLRLSDRRRASRNSFGTSLPIPRSPRSSRGSWLGGKQVKAAARRSLLASQVQDVNPETVARAKNMAFAFDIDGVLVHGLNLIPEAARVMELLNGDNELGIKIPFILLTNGGGKTETMRTEQLSRILGHPISVDQFIQSHTPMQALSEYYETVLVVGGEADEARAAAEEYGFANVVLPMDILAWDPSISPWKTWTEKEKRLARPQDFERVRFDAVLVFADSRDYATDMQLIIDLLMSDGGRIGTRAQNPLDSQLPIYFSHGDLVMPTEYKGPVRMTQGAFRIGVEAMFKALTGGEMERVIYGKPELAQYKYADEVLKAWMKEIHNEYRLPEHIYMVGDNPQSDIIGGNMYGWNTCLVRTGVFQGADNDEENPANFGVFANVLEAVQAVIKKELGSEFKMKWSDRVNPMLRTESIPAIE
ncbi:hypothetical protein KEM52_002818, partial [Ascosphaera acerosa]